MTKRRGLGGLESEVLAALWAADSPLTVSDVVSSLDQDLAYTTIATVLTRLVDKAAVKRTQVGRAWAYSPVLDQAGMAAQRMRAMLDRGGNTAAVLARFVATLNPAEERAVAALLSDAHDPDGAL